MFAILMVMAAFAMRYYSLSQEVARLQEMQRVAQSRQQALQQTILSQHDVARSVQRDYDQLYRQAMAFETEMAAQVEQFKVELQQIQRLSDEVRDLIGLEDDTLPTPEAALEQSVGGIGAGRMQATLIDTETPNVDLTVDEILNVETNPATQELQGLYNLLPAWYGQLQVLRDRIDERLTAVDPSSRSASGALVRRLALRDAAPRGWPADGDVSSQFGYRIFRERRHFHTGIDVAVWHRTPVHATANGTVVAAGWQAGYGWTVEIEHEHGYSTLYGHLSRYLVDVGDPVKKGQTIGFSGSSGNSTGPHLHYEIRLNGIPVDPWRYMETANDGK
jgi:murein DD-endopeptidase MepM/ murein hydrolase activator NlpD